MQKMLEISREYSRIKSIRYAAQMDDTLIWFRFYRDIKDDKYYDKK